MKKCITLMICMILLVGSLFAATLPEVNPVAEYVFSVTLNNEIHTVAGFYNKTMNGLYNSLINTTQADLVTSSIVVDGSGKWTYNGNPLNAVYATVGTNWVKADSGKTPTISASLTILPFSHTPNSGTTEYIGYTINCEKIAHTGATDVAVGGDFASTITVLNSDVAGKVITAGVGATKDLPATNGILELKFSNMIPTQEDVEAVGGNSVIEYTPITSVEAAQATKEFKSTWTFQITANV